MTVSIRSEEVSSSPPARIQDPIYGRVQDGDLWILVSVLAATVLTFLVLLFGWVVIRQWNPQADHLPEKITAGVLVSLTVFSYWRHCGKKVLFIVYFIIFTMKGMEVRNFYLLFIPKDVFNVLVFWAFLYLGVVLVIFFIIRIQMCLAPVVRLDGTGISISYVSKKIIPWSLVTRIEEIKHSKAHFFEIVLRDRHRIHLKLFWSLYARNPVLSVKLFEVSPMQLREALGQRGRSLRFTAGS
ncbi:hypothetical protein [Phaeospirillum tilakii]|uniref:PH domain-containing protein n=1 Tax=Phaeospirillum tilakii TaxID=741673 RepID=A0ABW5C4L8_9PROT